MNTIAFPGDELTKLRQLLLGSSPEESAAILVCGYWAQRSTSKLLVRDIIPVPDQAYVRRSPSYLEIAPTFVARCLKKARQDGLSLVFAHSHPLCDDVELSDVDTAGEERLMPVVFQRAPNRPHGTLVLGRMGFAGRIYRSARRSLPLDRIVEVGRRLVLHDRQQTNVFVDPLFDRSVRAFGVQGQRVIRQVRVGIVGLGGTGAVVAQQLAYLGVRDAVVIDSDVVEHSNLNRLVGATVRDIGRSKASVARRAFTRLDTANRVKAIVGTVLRSEDARNLLDRDIIFCCTDSHGSRAILNQLAYQYLIPVIDMGARIDAVNGSVASVTGRVQMLGPDNACLICQSLLDSEVVRRELLSEEERAADPYIVGAPGEVQQPAVISINTTVASLAVTMFLAAVAGLPSAARNQVYDGVAGRVRTVEVHASDSCVVCSLRGVFAKGEGWAMPWRN